MTDAPKHTPGPWKLILWGNEQYPYPLSVHTADDENWIARDGTCAKLADARLIAAAPELVAALARLNAAACLMIDRLKSGDPEWASEAWDLNNATHDARAALAKAEGRADD